MQKFIKLARTQALFLKARRRLRFEPLGFVVGAPEKASFKDSNLKGDNNATQKSN